MDLLYNIKLFDLLLKERYRQDDLHPETKKFTDADLFLVLAEEFGEIAKALNERDKSNLHEELIQTAAVCFRWLEMMKEDQE